MIGRILKENKNPEKFPCYKVIKSNGEIGGYNQGIEKKKSFLRKEGIIINGNKIKDFKKILFDFKV